MRHDEANGCREYATLSRRHFLSLSSGLVATALSQPWLPRVAFAKAENSDRDVLVSVFLRGGADSLSLCVPFGEPAYYRHRPNLAIAQPDSSASAKAIDLDGFFGFPPALSPLMPAFRDSKLAVVHACGLATATRSHFKAMHFIEVGEDEPPSSLTTGWLGRHLLTTAPSLEDGLLRAVGIGFGLQRTLVGGPSSLPVPDLGTFGLSGDAQSLAERRARIEALYRTAPEALRNAAENTSRTIDLLQQINFAGYQPAGGATYPQSELGRSLAATAALIKAEVGIEAVAVDAGGWDTHEQQAPVDGQMALVMSGFASAIAAFYQDMASGNGHPVTLVAQSEFGRNVFENGSAGTDHGHGGAMFVLGERVMGGRVIRHWPGLEPEQLYEGQDLEVTIDYRDILSEILVKRLANPDIRAVFADAGYTPRDHGIILA